MLPNIPRPSAWKELGDVVIVASSRNPSTPSQGVVAVSCLAWREFRCDAAAQMLNCYLDNLKNAMLASYAVLRQRTKQARIT